MSKPTYYYNKSNECFIMSKIYTDRCQLHGEFISIGVLGSKIRTSGKPSSVQFYTSMEDMHHHSKEYLELKFPELKSKE